MLVVVADGKPRGLPKWGCSKNDRRLALRLAKTSFFFAAASHYVTAILGTISSTTYF